MKKIRPWLTIPVLVFIIIVGSWLAWFHTRPIYSEMLWASLSTSSQPEFILYLFDTTPSNAVQVLRDGLMNELERSGELPPGYPKLSATPWAAGAPCQDKSFAAGGRYFIQLSEAADNYIELPLCPRTAKDSYLIIYILPVWPWAQVDGRTPKMFLGMSRHNVFQERHDLKSGQRELILQSLNNAGVKLYLDEYFQNRLKILNGR